MANRIDQFIDTMLEPDGEAHKRAGLAVRGGDSPNSAAQSAEAQLAEGMTHAKPDSPTAQSVIPEFSSVPWDLMSERDWDNEQEGK